LNHSNCALTNKNGKIKYRLDRFNSIRKTFKD
jgi:hypothetical protein